MLQKPKKWLKMFTTHSTEKFGSLRGTLNLHLGVKNKKPYGISSHFLDSQNKQRLSNSVLFLPNRTSSLLYKRPKTRVAPQQSKTSLH